MGSPDLHCYVCGAPATCIGRYEGHGPVRGGCDEHCLHGNEDGWCCELGEAFDGLVETVAEVDRLTAEVAEKDALLALWSGGRAGRVPEGWRAGIVRRTGHPGAEPALIGHGSWVFADGSWLLFGQGVNTGPRPILTARAEAKAWAGKQGGADAG